MKVLLFLLVFVIVLLIVYFALIELRGERRSTYWVPLSTEFMITSYLNQELAEHIRDTLERLVREFHPSRVLLGETDDLESRVSAPYPLRGAFVLYKTTSLDFTRAIIEQIKSYLRDRGIPFEEADFSHRMESRYHYIYVALS